LKGCEKIEGQTEKKGNKTTLETIVENEKPISNLIDKVNETINNIADKIFKHQEQERKFSIKMSFLLATLIIFIVIIASVLTYYNKIDGSTFTFLLGLIVGYILTFFTGAIYPPE
jgi:xanthine/uracil permease